MPDKLHEQFGQPKAVPNGIAFTYKHWNRKFTGTKLDNSELGLILPLRKIRITITLAEGERSLRIQKKGPTLSGDCKVSGNLPDNLTRCPLQAGLAS